MIERERTKFKIHQPGVKSHSSSCVEVFDCRAFSLSSYDSPYNHREEVSPHTPDDTGRIPLPHAVQGWHNKVVKILLAYEEVDPNKPDTWDATLLWHAAASGDRLKLVLLKLELLGMLTMSGTLPGNVASQELVTTS